MSKSLVRDLYKTMSYVQTHLVQSTEIATTCLCPYLFKLSYPFGVVRAQRDYVVADTVHDIMSLALPSTILDNWEYGIKNFENRARTIERDSAGIVESVMADKKDWVRREGRQVPENYDCDVGDRFHGLLIGFTKRIIHRLPDRLSGLVDEFALYGGLRSAPEVALRRLSLAKQPDLDYREIIQPDEVTTWVNINGTEEILASSWANDIEAKACAKICDHLTHLVHNKSIVVVTRYQGQRVYIKNYLKQKGCNGIRVTTTTGALGTQADIVLVSLVRNNSERIVGAAGTLQDLNVAISRAKEKLIILGNFDTMSNGWFSLPSITRHGFKSPARSLARLIDSKYGKVIDAPHILNY